MAAEGVHDRLPPGRVSTGTSGLDAMLEGGLVARRPYLVVGPSGTGKTTLALQFLIDGVRRGERVLLVTMDEPPNEMRINHRNLGPELLKVEVFDAIPDIMRYERVPFKDIAAVRQAIPFGKIPLEIRRSPELTAVEVTMTGLEQMLRSEVQRRTYSRVVIDSLTALQYFCMKGFDPVAGAQAFLRFLSDLHATTILTVESPLEDAETPERMLARGEMRLFRWEFEGRTVRAIGVEKFRGSSHDVRLHPYRIGPRGLDINLEVTISRDTRQITEPKRAVEAAPSAVAPVLVPEEVITPLDPLAEEVQDLVLVGADVAPLRTEIDAALRAASTGNLALARGRLSRANALVIGLSDSLADRMKAPTPSDAKVAEAFQRIVQRSEAARTGMPPTKLPPPKLLEVQLAWVLSLLPEEAPAVPPVAAPGETAPSAPEAPLPPEGLPEVVEAAGAGVDSPSPTSEAGAPPGETVPGAAEVSAVASEVSAPSPPPTLEGDGGTISGPEVPAPASEPPSVPPEPEVVSTEVAPELPTAEVPPPVPEGTAAMPGAPSSEPGEPAPSSVPEPSPPLEPPGPVDESAPETVEGILAAATPSPADPGATEMAQETVGPDATAPPPSLPPEPPAKIEAELSPPASPGVPPPLSVETLPPAPFRDAAAPARPLRPWAPPALPTAARRPVPPSEVPRIRSPPPAVKIPAPPVPATLRERRPPLPRSIEELLAPTEPHLLREKARTMASARAAGAAPTVPPPPAPISRAPAAPATAVPVTPAAPAPAAPPATAPAAAKRKRKPRSTTGRKKAAAGGAAPASAPSLSTSARKGEVATSDEALPPHSVGAPPAPAKPKRRPARKRKAPAVVVAHPGPAPASEDAGAAASAPPPLPTPPAPPPEEPATSKEEP